MKEAGIESMKAKPEYWYICPSLSLASCTFSVLLLSYCMNLAYRAQKCKVILKKKDKDSATRTKTKTAGGEKSPKIGELNRENP